VEGCGKRWVVTTGGGTLGKDDVPWFLSPEWCRVSGNWRTSRSPDLSSLLNLDDLSQEQKDRAPGCRVDECNRDFSPTEGSFPAC
jgi:hypothetical protein